MQKSMDVRGYKKYLTNTYGSSHNTMRFHTMIANIVNKMENGFSHQNKMVVVHQLAMTHGIQSLR